MARTVDVRQHAARRGVILDAAEHLAATVGFQEMTIQQVIENAGISKGAFYHYFASKGGLLEAMVTRRLDRWYEAVAAAEAAEGTPSQRLTYIGRALAAAKKGDRTLLLEALPSLYQDENAVVYVHLRRAAVERFLPPIRRVVEEGLSAGDFTAPSAAGTARVVLSILQECADVTARHLLALSRGGDAADELVRDAESYVAAIHAVLHATPGSLDFIDAADLEGWIRAATGEPFGRNR